MVGVADRGMEYRAQMQGLSLGGTDRWKDGCYR